MREYLKLKAANCKNCHKCIRHCPVKAISFSEGQANVLQEDCILCGECFVTCPQNAKIISSDLDQAKALVAEGNAWVSLAPSFLANYPGATIGTMQKALAALGFAGAEETALGATMVKTRYDEMVRQREASVILSSCCHSVNTLIQKYYPGALPYLAHVASPMLAHCGDIKERSPGAKTVFIGPCVSKKAEADLYPGYVDCVLTFEELGEWLEEENLTIELGAPETGGKARLFPIPGGILRAMDADCEDFSYIAIDGVEQCIAAIREVLDGSLQNCFIEMSACKGGCVGGPAMHHRTVMSHTSVINRAAGQQDFAVRIPTAGDLVKEMPSRVTAKPMPGSKALEEVLRKMGKTQPEHELNCGTCGYDTCRDKAVAVLLGKAEISMCLPYLMEKAESFSDNIVTNAPYGVVVVNDIMEIQQINRAACQLMKIGAPRDVMGRQLVCILDPTPFLDVLHTGRNISEKHIYLAEYDRYVTLTIIRETTANLLICIMRDITQEEEARNIREELSQKTIEITDRVIEKQMRAVQEIASLLGETTAETKVALTKLKETLRNE